VFSEAIDFQIRYNFSKMSMSIIRSRRKNKQQRGGQIVDPTKVPQLSTTIKLTHTFRFVSTAGITGRSLLFTELLDLLCMATSATAAARIMNSVKIKRLQIWAATSVATSSLSVLFQKGSSTGAQSGNSVNYSDTALGVSQVAHIDVKFSDKEQVGQWQGPSVTSIYGIISVPQGGVVDITLSYSLMDFETAFPVVASVVGASAGRVYCRALDNSQATPQLNAPVGYTVI